MKLRPGSCLMCGSAITVDELGQVVSHPPVASCATLTKKAAAPSPVDSRAQAATPRAADSRRQPAGAPSAADPATSPCCRFFMVGHTVYKGVYLPSVEEWVEHGYPRERYEHAMAQERAHIDRKPPRP